MTMMMRMMIMTMTTMIMMNHLQVKHRGASEVHDWGRVSPVDSDSSGSLPQKKAL
jgi:hypothetical protein